MRWGTTTGTLTGATTDGSVGRTPSRNVTVTGTSTAPRVSVSWTDAVEGTETPAKRTAERRFETAGQLAEAVTTALFGETAPPAGQGVALTYDVAGKALVFGLEQSTDPAATTSTLDLGDLLRPVAHLSALVPAEACKDGESKVEGTPTCDGALKIDAGGAVLDVGFGVSLVDDAGVPALDPRHADDTPSDRFFATTGPGAELQIGTLAVTPGKDDFQLDGQVGYLGVTATGDAYALTKKDSTKPALRVDLLANGARGTAGDANGTGVAGSVLLRRVLGGVSENALGRPVVTADEGVDLYVSADRNLRCNGTLEVAAAAPLTSLVPGPHTVTVDWDELGPDVQPTVTVTEAYRKALLPYDITPQVTGTSTAQTASTVLTDSSAHFLRDFGLAITAAEATAGAVLDLTLFNRTTGATCSGIRCCRTPPCSAWVTPTRRPAPPG